MKMRQTAGPGPLAAAAGARASRLAAALLALAALATTPAAAQHSFTWAIADRGAVTALNATSTFHTDIINTGPVTDTYRVTLVADMPASWLTTMCDSGLCYPPFITTLQYTVAPGDTLYVGINITPMVDAGGGSSQVTVSSLGAPALVSSASFTVLTGGAGVLVVDADGAPGTPTALLDAIAASGRATSRWDRAAAGKLAAPELGAFDAVLWHAGDSAAGLDGDDRAALAAFLGAGGRLLVGGADIVRQSCDPASPAYDAAAVAWYASTLGVGLAGTVAATQVTGVPGDPVGGGLSFAINGGGANAQPDALAAAGGTACLAYAGGATAGIRRQAGAGKSVCLGFGVAGIADAGARAAFVDAALDWLDNDASSAPLPAAPTILALSATPNPFNPRTAVVVENGAGTSLPGSLDVYDLRGRLVRALRRGEFAPGRTLAPWDGRDDSGRPLPGGAYVARLSIAGHPGATVKLLLAK